MSWTISSHKFERESLHSMSAALNTSAILSTKRKRVEVSYLDACDDLFDGDDARGESTEHHDPDDYDKDLSATWGSRKVRKELSNQFWLRLTVFQKPPKASTQKKAKLGGSTSSKNTKKPFPFMSLPPELRDMIYEQALNDDVEGFTLTTKIKNRRRTVARTLPITGSEDIWLTWGPCPPGLGNRQSQQSQQSNNVTALNQLAPSLLAVNKQIRSEALSYLYGSPFTFEDTHALHAFLATIGSHREFVSDVIIKGWGRGRGTKNAMNFAAFPLLALCPNLKKLTIDCHPGWSSAPKALAGRVYRDTHHFLEAYGFAKGDRYAAVDVIELTDAASSPYSSRDSSQNLSKEDRAARFREELRKLLK